MRYLQILDNMPPPKLEKGVPHEHEYVVEDPNILYDKLNKSIIILIPERYRKSSEWFQNITFD
jgi:hypothetical protein